MSTPLTSLQKSAAPAHEMWVELDTRITSKDLHFRSGQEEAAIKSIVEVFKGTRPLMKMHRGADEFLALAANMLQVIRPYTARWHSMMDAQERLRGAPERRQFRTQLLELRPQLVEFAKRFESLSHGHAVTLPAPPKVRTLRMGAPVPLGISGSRSRPTNYRDVDASEREHVGRRRGLTLPVPEGALFDGTGLALSGGGIRSATFCLGVVQVLAEKKLLPQFDYVSTVSGGGYFGSFLSNQFDDDAPAPGTLGEEFDPRAEEPATLRHLRNSSQYLLPKTTSERLRLAGILLSGLLSTTLLTAALPVAAAFLFRIIAHIWGFGPAVQRGFWAVAAIAGLGIALCWLARPLRKASRDGRALLDTLAADYLTPIAAAALALGCTPALLDWMKGGLTYLQVTGFTALSTAISGAILVPAMRFAWKYRKALSRLFMLSGIVLFGVVYLWTANFLGREPAGYLLTPHEGIVLLALVAWGVWALSINLNETGLHRYYRDKLAECYVAAPAHDRDAPNPPPLTELSERLPYHLINTTVNLTSSRNPELRGRGGDFFLLSKHWCGSPILGDYQKTAEVTAQNPDLDLATAMAVSGAAASTNMGWQTMREYRTLMAIFNVRLGYWLRWSAQASGLKTNAFAQLGREILGRLDDAAPTLNLSDGGHIENLAVYELIRRRVRFIVCVDGGMDAEMTCVDLNRLQRLVAIDFGYRIEFDAEKLKLINRYSSDYGALVKIDYTPEETSRDAKQLGWILYLKLAMLGTEPSYLLDYRRENPLFPHQSTLDQFFDEAQFEAYRKLGECAARSFFSLPFADPTPTDLAARTAFKAWFTQLATNLLRDTDDAFA